MKVQRFSAMITSIAALAAFNAVAASKPDAANVEFFSNPTKIEKLALVVDTLIVEDIKGSSAGAYRSDHDALVPVIGHGVKHAFEARGYRVAEFHANAGLFANEQLELMYADRSGKSTGEAVTYPIYTSDVPVWANGPLQTVMQRVFEGAEARMESEWTLSRIGPQLKPKESFSIEVPPEIKALPVDAIAIVSSAATNVSLVATIFSGMGAGRYGAFGGALAGIARGSSAQAALLTIVDIRDGKVLWFEEGRPPNANATGTRMLRHTLVHLMVKLPNRNAIVVPTSTAANSGTTSDEDTAAEDRVADDIEESDGAIDVARVVGDSKRDQVDFANTPSVLTDPGGWSAADLRDAYRAGAIQVEEYQKLRRSIALEYRQQLENLKQSLRTKQKTKHEHEVEEFRLLWGYQGFH